MKKHEFVAGSECRGVRLDEALTEWLKPEYGEKISKAKARKLIVAGAVYLNSKRTRIASKALVPGARVRVFVDPGKLESSGVDRAKGIRFSESWILFEDDFLLCLNKPWGLPTQPTLDEARANLFGLAKKFLTQRNGGTQADVYLGLHHRLDRDTSGVVLFTKKKEVNKAVGELFSEHQIQKTYLAVVENCEKKPGESWSVENHLAKGSGKGKRTVMRSVRSGGDYAETHFRVLRKLSRGVLIEAKPKTGRMHQIRVHLSESGMPILGDFVYGSGQRSGQPVRMMLHAASLVFRHPVTALEMKVEAPLPAEFESLLV